MNINFECTCGQALVIDEAGAGLQLECPECGLSLTVPQAQPGQSEPPPSPPIMQHTKTVTAAQPQAAASVHETKQCPFCAETIKREARVCRFCGYNLETGQPQQPNHPKNVSAPVVKAESSVESGVKLGVGMFIILPAIIIAVIIALILVLGIGGILLGGLIGFIQDNQDAAFGIAGILLLVCAVFVVVFARVRKRRKLAGVHRAERMEKGKWPMDDW